MGYLHIPNLYKEQEILAFKQCYALEKIHGTSAHVRFSNGKVTFSSGGESHDRFFKLFNTNNLLAKFKKRYVDTDSVVVYGEAYGGSCQGMSKTYGAQLRFVVFDVQVGDVWLAVPQAEELASFLGLQFVYYTLIPTSLDEIDAERDRPSVQAARNGIVEPKVREGVVLRPIFEVTLAGDKRIIAKHKQAEFSERGTPKVEMDSTKRQLLEGADAIALEWVTPMRLEHVIAQLISSRGDKEIHMQDIPAITKLMVADVLREASGEIVTSDAARKAINVRAVALFKAKVQEMKVPAGTPTQVLEVALILQQAKTQRKK